MAIKSSNYFDTFISVAEDCPVRVATIPPQKEHHKTVANLQFELIKNHPYQYTSDDVLFQVYASKNAIPKKDYKQAREIFFSKGQPCFRASPLTKRYGWGVHSDAQGRIALYAIESKDYVKLSGDKKLKQLRAMRSKRG